MKLYISRAVFLALVVGVGPTRADLVITGVTRSVTSAATGALPDSDISGAPGSFIADALSVGAGAAGDITGHGAQGSDIPLALIGPTIMGAGLAEGTAEATGVTGFSSLGDSFFDVLFTVSVTGPVTLDAAISWTAAPLASFGGGAFVLLEEVGGPTLASITKGPGSPGPDSLLTTLVLTMGTPYHLRAVAHVDGFGGLPGFYDADATWRLTLSSVPEVGALLLMAPVAFGVAFVAWRRKKS